MDLAYSRASAIDDGPDDFEPSPRSFRVRATEPAAPVEFFSYTPARSRWSIGLVVALHAVALFALVKMDIVGIRHAPPKPLSVTMVSVEPAPPEHAPPPPPSSDTPPPEMTRQIVAPPPVVAMLTSPPMVAVALPPPSTVLTPVVSPAPPATPSAPVRRSRQT